VGITEDFISSSLASSLQENLLELFRSGALHAAGTGNNTIDHKEKNRTDMIHWLERDSGNPFENSFLDRVDAFILYLNNTCYTGITGYEFHYTLYPAGSFYRRHRDQFRNDDSRKYSMILYLNDDWQTADGGELCIYHKDNVQMISPSNKKLVFFKSNELEHEVMITHTPRLSITGWLKN
jgi:SM-20-related protein